MAALEHDDKPGSSPLDAEREKLRKAGYNDQDRRRMRRPAKASCLML